MKMKLLKILSHICQIEIQNKLDIIHDRLKTLEKERQEKLISNKINDKNESFNTGFKLVKNIDKISMKPKTDRSQLKSHRNQQKFQFDSKQMNEDVSFNLKIIFIKWNSKQSLIIIKIVLT